MAQHVEATMLSVWRRVLTEGGGPELTLAEAATLLGSSVDTVRRRIKAGQIRAFHDDRGRIRISASVTYTPDGDIDTDAADAESMARMWNELKAVHEQLDAARAEEERLQAELEAAEKALDYTKAEVANLWQVLTTRNLKQAARKAAEIAHEGPKVLDLAEQRTRIRTKVNEVREIARRRRWPWISMVS
jgi:excisionase family DNA binding protein